MDERPGTPSFDAWQPHEPGGPVGPGAAGSRAAAGSGEAAGAASGGAFGGAAGVPAASSADWSTPATAAWPSYGPDVATAGRPDTGAPRSRRLLAGAALATGLAVGGAGVAAAVTSGNDALQVGPRSGVPGFSPGAGEGSAQELPGEPGQSGQVPQGQVPLGEGLRGGHGRHHGGGGRGGFGGFRGALHGELVVPQEDGTGTRTITVQSGSVTSVSSTRLVVKSTDGFSSTYVLNSSTDLMGDQPLSAIKAGHEVSVVASKSGSTLTAIRVGDRNLRPSFDDRDRYGRQSPAPSPSDSPTTSGTSSGSA